jgi:hypothetical protein
MSWMILVITPTRRPPDGAMKSRPPSAGMLGNTMGLSREKPKLAVE